ncbi:hypothetical protein Q5P01_008502 [Channa striata]|uniref:Ig-like domain-containing protein n=1 Tax=Channa striata TaxID=64152 RepID=A0AA88N463_CHASR|nr:hypothetical protein Q5P01_008502 [Channa striata]
MMVLWVTLLLLQRGHSLVPVTTVQLGESGTLTCTLPSKELSSRKIHWYKQISGDTLKLIVTVWKSATPEYAPEFSKSRINVTTDESFSNLTILRTIREDEGMYHCGVTEWISTEWSGTYLLVKGNSQRTSNYTVVQQSTASDQVRPGDSVTLQCSVLSDSENQTCPGDHSVYWFRAGSEKSHPEIIHTDGNGQCEKRSDTVKSCVYGLYRNISSSDAGTYYCAVATCGQILFGNGTKLDFVQTTYSVYIAVVTLAICLAFSIAGNVVLICSQRVHEQNKGMENQVSQALYDDQPVHEISEAGDNVNYVALNFSERKTRGQKKNNYSDDSVYSHVKC